MHKIENLYFISKKLNLVCNSRKNQHFKEKLTKIEKFFFPKLGYLRQIYSINFINCIFLRLGLTRSISDLFQGFKVD